MIPHLQDLVDVSLLTIILKGVVIGVLAAAPTGPSGVLVIQRTINKGRKWGLLTGLGVGLSDAIYILCTSLSLSLVISFIEDARTFFMVKMVGCALLLMFGIHTVRNNPFAKGTGGSSSTNRPNLYYYFSGTLVAITNPLVILIYLALFTYFSFPLSEFEGTTKLVAYLAVLGGDALWWTALSFLINKLRNRFDLKGIWVINRVLGVVLIAASVIWLLITLIQR